MALRLLDWTKSPYVAAYFALEDINKKECGAIWAVNEAWLRGHAARLICESLPQYHHVLERDFEGSPDLFKELIDLCFDDLSAKNGLKCIVQVSPKRQSRRQIIQQGCFLSLADPSCTFLDNLGAMNVPESARFFHKLSISPNVQAEGLMALNHMNMERGSLFPGLDGFGQSLTVACRILTRAESPYDGMKQDLESGMDLGGTVD